MSEFQYVAFRAVDGPVSKQNLAFMRRQSTRAEITPWTFDNEYSFGDFHGDAIEMVRRGYDIYFHYANFGTRLVMLRLPAGLPDPQAAEAYFVEDAFEYLPDKTGPAGILHLNPPYDAGSFDEYLFEYDPIIDQLPALRSEVMAGDLRPLYLGWLAGAREMFRPHQAKEPPVPAGMGNLTPAQRMMASFYGIGVDMLNAIASTSAPLTETSRTNPDYAQWLKQQSDRQRFAWLEELLSDPDAKVRAKMLAAFQQSSEANAWPTRKTDRTLKDLIEASEAARKERARRKAERAARQKAERLKAMAADPYALLREVDAMITPRGSGEIYSEIAHKLAELHEATAGTADALLADRHAVALKEKYPSRSGLIFALREQGFLSRK